MSGLIKEMNKNRRKEMGKTERQIKKDRDNRGER
jgi:hypothetical protein